MLVKDIYSKRMLNIINSIKPIINNNDNFKYIDPSILLFRLGYVVKFKHLSDVQFYQVNTFSHTIYLPKEYNHALTSQFEANALGLLLKLYRNKNTMKLGILNSNEINNEIKTFITSFTIDLLAPKTLFNHTCKQILNDLNLYYVTSKDINNMKYELSEKLHLSENLTITRLAPMIDNTQEHFINIS